MEPSEQELAQKMKARMEKERERQRRWRSRQKKKGLKSIAGMISQSAFDIIQRQKKLTGEKVSDILEKAILNLDEKKQNNEILDSSDHTMDRGAEQPTIDPVQNTISEKETINLIIDMRAGKNMPFNDIAKHLNNQGIPTLSVADNWDGKAVYDLYKISKQ